MKRFKRYVVKLGVSVCCMVMMPMIAFASNDTKLAGEYDMLRCELSGNREEIVSFISVKMNTEHAYLFVSLEAWDEQGTILDATGMQKSARGALEFIFYWRNLSSECHTVYGMQGMWGGSSGPAKVVYTKLALD